MMQPKSKNSNPYKRALEDLQIVKQMGVSPTQASYSSIVGNTVAGGVSIKDKLKVYDLFLKSDGYDDFRDSIRNLDLGGPEMRQKMYETIPEMGISNNVNFMINEEGGFGYKVPVDRYEKSGDLNFVFYKNGTYKLLDDETFTSDVDKYGVNRGKPKETVYREYSYEDNPQNRSKDNEAFKNDQQNVKNIVKSLGLSF